MDFFLKSSFIPLFVQVNVTNYGKSRKKAGFSGTELHPKDISKVSRSKY
jgi:hypothetical protein